MARKKKNNKEQTFNVYPYLGGYQHFMKGGGALPQFKENGQVNVSDIAKRIRPTNQYKYDRTFNGVTEEWKNNVGNIDDRDKYNGLGGLGPMGLTANLFKGASDLVGDVKGAFNKDSYKPGGKYSKFDQDGGLRYGRVNLKNTTDNNALLHGENFAKYLNMNNKERKKLTESGDLRNTDLWWSTDDMIYGKHNWMDRNDDGTAKYDGLNYQVAKKRSEAYVDPDTGERLFSVKQKNKDGSFTYFNDDDTIDNYKSTQTQYDVIEENKGPGGLGDVNAQTMLFDFDKEGENKLSGFTSFDETTETKSSCSDGTSLTEEDCTANGGVWNVSDPTTNTELTPHEYDPEENYGPYTETVIEQEESDQQKLNREAIEKGENPDARYGTELKKYTIGGVLQDDQSSGLTMEFNSDQFNDDQTATFYKYGGPLAKFQDGKETEEESIDDKEERIYQESKVELPGNLQQEKDYDYDQMTRNFTLPANDPYSFAPTNETTDIQAEPESTWEEPGNINKLKNWFKGDSHLNKDPGPDFSGSQQMNQNIDDIEQVEQTDKTLGYDARVLDPTNRTDMEGAAPEGSDDLGVDVNYGDGPIQNAYNRTNEFFNTGAVGATKDIYGKASEFVVDKAIPFLDDIYNRNVNKQNEMFKRSVSAEDIVPKMEENVGTGDRGFADVNKGGYGDSLYGTGKVYGQAQQGKELMPQQMEDLSGVANFMSPSFDGLKYRDEYLERQKTYLGKMAKGGQLPSFLKGGNTGQDAVLCDAYDMPVGPTNPELSKADYTTPVLPYDDPQGKGTGAECAIPGTCPGMKYGGALPKFQDKGENTSNWNLSGYFKGEQGFIPDFKGESTKKTVSENESVNKALDYTQTGLTVAGMQDYSGPIAAGADLFNSALSGARAYAAPEGSEQRKVHTENAVLNATSAIPGYGLASASASLAKDTAGYAGVMDTTKSVGTQVTDSAKTSNFAENMNTEKSPKTTAKFGGEQIADIDMDLYYKLMKAGANIQIIG